VLSVEYTRGGLGTSPYPLTPATRSRRAEATGLRRLPLASGPITQPDQDPDESIELQQTIKRVHDDPYKMTRQLSVERVMTGKAQFKQRLMLLRDTIQDSYGIAIPNIDVRNVDEDLLLRFADGHILCVLANIKLRARGLPTIKPQVAPGRDKLGELGIVANFNNLERACLELGMVESEIPTMNDFQSLETEQSLSVKQRMHHIKIVTAIELLATVPEDVDEKRPSHSTPSKTIV
jgi:hypothetical protein